MALTQALKVWLSRPQTSPEDIAGKVMDNGLSLADLEAFAAIKPQFRPKLDQVTNIVNNTPSPDFEKEYKRLLETDLSTDPASLLAMMDSFIAKWGNKPYAAEKIRAVSDRRDSVEEKISFPSLKERAEIEISRCGASDEYTPDIRLIQDINAYCEKW